jgi:hypothetical protein
MSGAVIPGTFTLQPKAVFSSTSGLVVVCSIGMEVLVAEAVIRVVGGQGRKNLPLCRWIKVGSVGWEGGDNFFFFFLSTTQWYVHSLMLFNFV